MKFKGSTVLLMLVSLFIFSCNFDKIGDQLVGDLQKGVKGIQLDSVYIESLVRSAVSDAIDEAFKSDLNGKISMELDPILAQLQDSIGVISDELVEKIIGDQTALWLDARMAMINEQLTQTAANVRNQILGEETRALTEKFIQEAVVQQLDGVFKNLLKDISSDANQEELIAIRKIVSVQLDSIIVAGFETAAINFDRSFTPVLEKYVKEAGNIIEKGDDLGTSTKINARSIIWQAVGGIAGLLLLGGFGWLFLWTRRYKSMIKILTKNIDGIPDQTIYDKVVGGIRTTMDNNGLNGHLKKILEEQELHDQPEWDDKDKQVLRLLSEQFADMENANLSKDQLTKKLFFQAQQLGLENHLKSILRQIGK